MALRAAGSGYALSPPTPPLSPRQRESCQARAVDRLARPCYTRTRQPEVPLADGAVG